MAGGEERFAEGLPPESAPVSSSAYVVQGGELSLSNAGQLELLLAMCERGAPLRTMVRGFSMTPFLRDGDVLTIAPLKGAPRVGDIVAFRYPENGRLAIHRLVQRTKKGWLAWGDNCPEPDGEVASGDILGRVILAERNGRRAYPWLGRAGALIALLNSTGMLAHVRSVWRLPRRAASFFLRRLQGLSVYRAIGGRLAARATVSIADQHDMDAVHRMMNPSSSYRVQPANPNVTNLIAKMRNEMIGFVQLVYRAERGSSFSGYWLYSMHVRARSRGLGVGEKLARCSIDRAKEKGAKELFLWVFEDNGRAIALYRKLGFLVIPSLSPLPANKEFGSERLRIVMRKDLTSNDEKER